MSIHIRNFWRQLLQRWIFSWQVVATIYMIFGPGPPSFVFISPHISGISSIWPANPRLPLITTSRPDSPRNDSTGQISQISTTIRAPWGLEGLQDTQKGGQNVLNDFSMHSTQLRVAVLKKYFLIFSKSKYTLYMDRTMLKCIVQPVQKKWQALKPMS